MHVSNSSPKPILLGAFAGAQIFWISSFQLSKNPFLTETKHMPAWQEGDVGRAGVRGAGDIHKIPGGVIGRIGDG